MKQRFNALDLKAVLHELRTQFKGYRVVNVYDADHKTYMIKLSKPDSKAKILIESGIRIHSTEYELPKNLIPSGFSMKLRKHIRSRRLESVEQLGDDRIVDLQFGSSEAAYHLIVELYDRGNILLTDFEYTILAVLRPRTDENSDVRFAVREKYPVDQVRPAQTLSLERLELILASSKDNDDLKKLLTSQLTFGGALVEHCLAVANFPDKCLIAKNFDRQKDLEKLFHALKLGESIIQEMSIQGAKGFIVQKTTKNPKLDKTVGGIAEEELVT